MNTYFQFKQFKIEQSNCAMKVSEIACIFGAWIQVENNHLNILDIGSGTGVLSLMIAQKNNTSKIDAVEIEEMCFLQGVENIKNSNFNHQIQCIHSDIKTFCTTYKYDMIICNPPFFENSLKSIDHQKNIAWHSQALSLESLFKVIFSLLKPSSTFYIILPIQRKIEIDNLSIKHNLYINKILYIQHSKDHAIAYFIAILSFEEPILIEETFIIKEMNKYTIQFKELLKDYYLKL